MIRVYDDEGESIIELKDLNSKEEFEKVWKNFMNLMHLKYGDFADDLEDQPYLGQVVSKEDEHYETTRTTTWGEWSNDLRKWLNDSYGEEAKKERNESKKTSSTIIQEHANYYLGSDEAESKITEEGQGRQKLIIILDNQRAITNGIEEIISTFNKYCKEDEDQADLTFDKVMNDEVIFNTILKYIKNDLQSLLEVTYGDEGGGPDGITQDIGTVELINSRLK